MSSQWFLFYEVREWDIIEMKSKTGAAQALTVDS